MASDFNPYGSPGAQGGPAGFVVPTPQPAKTFGLLNIIFGILLILWGACQGAGALIAPLIPQFVEGIQKKAQDEQEGERKAEIQALDEAEKAAETEEAKAQIVAQRDQVKARPIVNPLANNPGMSMLAMFKDRRFLIYTWAEVVSGLVLNGLMIASGIGLNRLRDSGRKLALGVAVAKLVRLVAIAVVTALVIAPLTAEFMVKMMADMQAGGGGGAGAPPPPGMNQQLLQSSAISTTIQGVAFAIFGSIYPALSLWFLTRPGVRAACLAKPKGVDDAFA